MRFFDSHSHSLPLYGCMSGHLRDVKTIEALALLNLQAKRDADSAQREAQAAQAAAGAAAAGSPAAAACAAAAAPVRDANGAYVSRATLIGGQPHGQRARGCAGRKWGSEPQRWSRPLSADVTDQPPLCGVRDQCD